MISEAEVAFEDSSLRITATLRWGEENSSARIFIGNATLGFVCGFDGHGAERAGDWRFENFQTSVRPIRLRLCRWVLNIPQCRRREFVRVFRGGRDRGDTV